MGYTVLIYQAEEGGFWAEVPSLPGCYSQGETIEETMKNIKEAIEAHLVSKDEGFQRALEEYNYLLDGEKIKPKFTGTNKKKRMDIFLCQRQKNADNIKNVIVELKNPSINLSSKELLQVDDYRTTILNEPQFNSNIAKWDFILVGNQFDSYIEGQIKNSKHHGEKSLVYSVENFKIYIKTWSGIFDEFEIAHDFLNEKLKLDKDKVIGELASAEEGVKLSGQRD